MNERIKELAKQTGYIWHASGDPQIYEFTPEKLDKFAELIVRECMNVILLDGKTVADAMPNADRGNYTMVAEQIGIINASMRYSNMIKQHFGVEE